MTPTHAGLLALVLSVSCASPLAGGEHFFLSRAGATMPVRVAGDVDSGTFVVTLQGGPGDSGFLLAGSPSYQSLEEDFALVYWDQRNCGSSQGNPEPDTITLADFQADLDLLLDVLEHRYTVDRIVLLGHSWGGTLGTSWLGDAERQARVVGWVDAAGVIDGTANFDAAGQFVVAYAQARVDDDPSWQEAIDWYAQDPDFDGPDIFEHSVWVRKAHGLVHDPDVQRELLGYLVEMAWYAPASGSVFTVARELMWEQLGLARLDLREPARRIQVPTLLVWGRHDGVVPIAQAELTLDSLGTDDARLVVLEASAHAAFAEEPAAFADAVRDFILELEDAP